MISLQVSKSEHLLTSKVEDVVGVCRFLQQELKVFGTAPLVAILFNKIRFKPPRAKKAEIAYSARQLIGNASAEMPSKDEVAEWYLKLGGVCVPGIVGDAGKEFLPAVSCWMTCMTLMGKVFYIHSWMAIMLAKPLSM